MAVGEGVVECRVGVGMLAYGIGRGWSRSGLQLLLLLLQLLLLPIDS